MNDNSQPWWRRMIGGRRAIYSSIGCLLGFAIGALGPFVVWYVFAAMDGFKPGGNSSAGTAFAILTIVTAPAGFVFGALIGDNYARTGKLTIGTPGHIEGVGGDTTEEGLARSLTVSRVHAFEDSIRQQPEATRQSAQECFLRDAISDYKMLVLQRLKSIALVSMVLFLFYPAALIYWIIQFGRAWREVREMRSRLGQLLQHWAVDLTGADIHLPRSLQGVLESEG